VNGVLLQPLEYPDAEELVSIRSTAPGMGFQDFPLSADYYFRFRSGTSACSDMGFYREMPASLSGDGDPEEVRAVETSHTLFSTLRTTALIGRVFDAGEDQPGAPLVAVLGYGLWQRRFGGDPGVLGRTLQLSGESYQIVGVMGPRFDFPGDVELWVPARFNAENASWSFSYPTIGRLGKGVSREQAETQLRSVVERIRDSYPEGTSWVGFIEDGQYAPVVEGMKDRLVASLEQPLWILLGTVTFVLLIACTNVANLILVRSENRRRESAVRAAIGATRGALIRQSLAESVLLAAAGGTLGIILAGLALPVVSNHAPPQLPRVDAIEIDGSVLLFSLGVTGFTVLLFGIAPILRLSSDALVGTLRQGGRGSTSGGPNLHRTRAFLVASQTALALVLMVGSGLLVRSFWRVLDADLGFAYHDLLAFRISVPEGRYSTPGQVTDFHEEVLKRLRALPGVESAAVADAVPLVNPPRSSPFGFEGMPDGEGTGRSTVMLDLKRVSEGYIEALGIPVLAGTTLQADDARNANQRIMVNEALSSRFWPGENPLGKRLRYPGDRSDGVWYTVVAVVGTVLEAGVREAPKPTVYLPLMNPADGVGWEVPSATYLLRGSNLRRLVRPVHETVWSVDPDIPLAGVRTGEEVVAASITELSFTMATLGVAAIMALLLGAIGLFGVLSYSVSQRRQEIAIHMAMGAEKRQVLGMVVGDGARITAFGIVLGLGGAWGLTRFLQGLLFQVEAVDPLTYGGMAAALLGVAILSAYLPARRAASVDPVESMRAE